MSIIIVTGASSGIGKAIYEHLRKRGPRPTVLGISRAGPDICCDFTKRDWWGDVWDGIRIKIGHTIRIDAIINCAGIMPLNENKGPHLRRSIMDVNFWAAYDIIDNLLLFMSDEASIINIASVSGMRPESDLPVYSASKAALAALTYSLAQRLAPKKIRVNCISPGFFQTNLVPEGTPEELIRQIPLGREAEADEILPVVDMLLQAKYMTGANIVIDGGLQWK